MGWVPGALWLVFLGTFYESHRRVRAQQQAGGPPERRIRRDPSSDAGMALQFAAVAIVLIWPPRQSWLLPGLIVAAFSIWLAHSALTWLGRQWRVQAVVTDDHELITGGPYQWIRHPVYSAFLGMLVATILLRWNPASALLALVTFVTGTERRVRAEERLLTDMFQDRFSRYKAATKWAYLPGLR